MDDRPDTPDAQSTLPTLIRALAASVANSSRSSWQAHVLKLLTSLGVTSADDFIAIQGPLWRVSSTHQPRLLSVAEATPKVFVYPEKTLRPGVSRLITGTPLHVYGPQDAYSYLSATEQGFHLPALWEGLRDFQTDSAADADLFFDFRMLHAPPLHYPHGASDDDPDEERLLAAASRRMCRTLHNESTLEHLSPRTRRAHFVVPMSLQLCTEHRRSAAKVGKGLPRLLVDLAWDGFTTDGAGHPDGSATIYVPGLSGIRWSKELEALGIEPPWRSSLTRPRSVLMTWAGRATTGAVQSVRIRQKIVEICKALGDDSACALNVNEDGLQWATGSRDGQRHDESTRANLRRSLKLKGSAVFCLEPPGWAPLRKSMLDSLLSGCIPVFFDAVANIRRYWPLHLRWAGPFFVAIDPVNFVAGRIDLAAKLARINRTAAQRLQATIAANAHQLVYGLGGHYPGDATETFVRGLHRLLNAPSAEACRRFFFNRQDADPSQAAWRCTI